MPHISVQHLSKCYRIDRTRDQRDALRHRLEGLIRSPSQWGSRLWFRRRPNHADFWALRDVSFDVHHGDVMGVIGRNGAGKSTLLKLLSRITEPTSGRIVLHGRVASLLEVGTGFHQELTGRENIYLNGAILGMSRSEIRRNFDAIVDFSEIGPFLDTPVKRYSSGMYVRLAFSVAAHLEPETLIIDEVLAVGDTSFQQKCLGKMGEVARGGRTVLFVSHNMAAVQGLCTKCVLLENGSLASSGPTQEVLGQYLRGLPSGRNTSAVARSGTGTLRIRSVHLEDVSGNPLTAVASGMDVEVVLTYESTTDSPLRNVDPGISLHLPDTTILSVLYASYLGNTFTHIPRSGQFRFRLNTLPLKEGRYLVGVRVVAGGEEVDWPQEPIGFIDVVAGDFYHTGSKGFDGGAPLLLGGDCRVTPAIP